MKVNICGVHVDRYSFDEVVNTIISYVTERGRPQYVVTPNAHHIVVLQEDVEFRHIYQSAFLSVPDGVPLLWAAKFLGTPLRGRINGTDLFEALCARAADRGLSVYLLGGRSGAADQAAQVLQSRYPALKIAGFYCPPFGFESDQRQLDFINQQIQLASPDILFVGLGAPKQEKWMSHNCQHLNVPISLGIGVSFELTANIVRRAPKWMQIMGLEWLFRLIVEPQRLWKRYLVGNLIFVYLVLKQRFDSGLLKRI